MKNEFYVTTSIPCKVVYRDGDRLKGDRFNLFVKLAAPSLDKDGFVVDFDHVQHRLAELRDTLESVPLDELLDSRFSVQALLRFIRISLDESLEGAHIIRSIYLEGDREGFGLETD